jgi:hypothetical protein
MPVSKTPLKVYVTRIGFHETIVAAPSQRAALAAWGVTRNLFSNGRAHDTRDAEMCRLALSLPGQVFARPAGSGKPFKLVTANDAGAQSERAATLLDDGPPEDQN